MAVDAVIVPRARCRHGVEAFWTVKQRLTHLPDAGLAVHPEAELLADRARSAVAADDVLGANRNGLAVRPPYMGGHAVGLGGERLKLMAEFHRNVGDFLHFGFQQRLERIL